MVNGWLAIPSSVSAELMAHAGWDSLCVDLQHGAIDYQVAVTMLQAISTTETVPLVRVPWNDPAIIGKLLDAGAYGVSARWSTPQPDARPSSAPAAMRPRAIAASARCGHRSMAAPIM